ncbi:hypothetical protein [Leuconostoc lactis]|uniref:hypothetical protein n=1 Tax=Leuconostoc lactis TaxID=1246 RepID=UPI00289D4BA7|nr:hypothetical protein [Leuconostoc lactis]
MDYETYKIISLPVQSEINEKIDLLYGNILLLINKNIETIKQLVLDPYFVFLDRNHSPLEKFQRSSLSLFKVGSTTVYFEVMTGKFVTYDYDSEFNIYMPNDVTDQIPKFLYLEPELYETIVHLVGLDGILQEAYNFKQQTLTTINTLI